MLMRPCRALICGLDDAMQADAQLLSTIMLVQDILLDDLKNGDRQQTRNRSTPTHVVGVVRCAQSVKACPLPGLTCSYHSFSFVSPA